LFNAYWNPLEFTIPAVVAGDWTPELVTEELTGTPSPPRMQAGAAISRPGRTLMILSRPRSH